MTILVVEKDCESRRLLESVLMAHGYSVISADNGKNAIELAMHLLPDLIITDVIMPIMDGFALCKEIKLNPQLQQIPIIFYSSAYADMENQLSAIHLGAARFIVKPVEMYELLGEISQVIFESEQRTKSGFKYSKFIINKSTDKIEESVEEQKKKAQQEEEEKLLAEKQATEKQKSELLEKNVLFDRLCNFPGGNAFIFCLNSQNQIEFISESISLLLGFLPQDLIGKKIEEILCGNDKNPNAEDFFLQLLQGKLQPPTHMVFRTNDEFEKMVLLSLKPIKNEQNQVLLLDGTGVVLN